MNVLFLLSMNKLLLICAAPSQKDLRAKRDSGSRSGEAPFRGVRNRLGGFAGFRGLYRTLKRSCRSCGFWGVFSPLNYFLGIDEGPCRLHGMQKWPHVSLGHGRLGGTSFWGNKFGKGVFLKL